MKLLAYEALALPALTMVTAVLECEIISDGPGVNAKNAVVDFFKRTYVTGEACPGGADDLGNISGPVWCGVCEGAAMYFRNSGSNTGERCFTEADLDEAMKDVVNQSDCWSNMKQDPYLELLYGYPDEFDSGGEDPCTNFC